MYCGKCGTRINNGETYCKNCGSVIVEQVKTPIETKVMDYQMAGTLRRVVACLIDYLIIGMIIDFIFDKTLKNEYALIGVGVLFLLYFIVLILSVKLKKQTIGQKITKIKLLRKDFSELSFGRGFIRSLLTVLFSIPSPLYLINFLWGFAADYTTTRQLIPDYICDTIVVKIK